MAEEERPVSFTIWADVDEPQVRQQADRMADIIEAAFARAAPGIGRLLGREISKGFRAANIDTGKVFDPFVKNAERAAGAAHRVFVAGADGIEEELRDLGSSAKRSFGVGEDAAKRLEVEMDALRRRTEATRETLQQVGANPNLLANVDTALERIIANQLEFNRDLTRISQDPDLLKGYRTEFENTRVFVGRETQALQSLLGNLRRIQTIEGNRANAAADRTNQERLLRQRQAHGREIAETQRLGAQTLAETRIAGQRQIQDERQRSRTRIELVRFTFQQIKILERGIAGVFRATGTIANSAFRTLSSATDRIGGLFRRSNRDLNEGLNGALIRREGAISNSFNRQTIRVRQELNQQLILIERFEAQASSGITGALTGRSRLGALFGGGLAFGGGFAAFQGLRNGIQVGGDFVQGLSVLGAQLELTEEQMAGVRAQSIELGNDISLPGVSALDAAQAIQVLAKQFANLGETALPNAQAAARGVLQLSRAVGVEAEEAARVVGASVNVFGISADQAVAVADQVTNTMTKAAGVAFGDYADSFTQAAGIVNLFTQGSEDALQTTAEFNAALAVLAKNALVGSDAGTAIKQFFLQGNRQTADAIELMQELTARAGETGTAFFDASGNARSLADAVDILRRGTADLTQQETANVFGKLFGSDAARTAVFLTQETAAGFEALTDEVLQLGSAERIAAAQNVGLRGALDALGSVIETQQIKTYERYQDVLGKVVLRFADLLDAFFEGRGRLGVLRDALLGAATALGALLAAKLVGEAFQFMALGIRAALTPLGLLVTSVTLLGAAFNVLRDASPEFRSEVNRIRDVLADRLSGVIERVGDGLARLGGFLRTEVVPRLIDFAVAAVRLVIPAVERVGQALETARGFIGDFVDAARGERVDNGGIFGFAERLGNVARDIKTASQVFINAIQGDAQVSPFGFGGRAEATQTRLAQVAEDLGNKLREAGEQARLFLGAIPTLVRPAIDEFRELGAAIEVIASGSLTDGLRQALASTSAEQIGSALGGAAIGTAVAGPIGATIGAALGFGFGNQLIDNLRPQLRRVVDFVRDFFAGEAETAGGAAGRGAQAFLLGPFQRAVGALGFFLGNLASDPRFVQAVAQLVGLAVLTGVNFVKGIGKGIADNLPGLTDLIIDVGTDAVKAGFDKIFDPAAIAKFIVSGLGAAVIGTALFRSLRRQTDAAGKKVGQSFLGSLGSTLRTGFTGSLNNPFAAGLFRGLDRVQSDVARRGEKIGEAFITSSRRAADKLQVLGVPLNVGFDDNQFRSATEQLKELERRVGAASLAGATLRSSFGGVIAGFREIGQGVKQVVDGIRFDFEDRGGRTIRSGVDTISRSLRVGVAGIRDSFRATGLGLGQALGGAIVSGVGAALSGQALGTADSRLGQGLGLAGVISSALFAGASVGGGPQGVVVGGIVAGIGLISAALTRSGEQAQLAADRIRGWREALSDTTGVGRTTAAVERLTELAANSSLDIQEAFVDFDFVQVANELLDGTLSAERVFTRLATAAEAPVDAIQGVVTAAQEAGVSIPDALRGLGGREVRQAVELLRQSLEGPVDVGDIEDALRLLFTAGGDVSAALRGIEIEGTWMTEVPKAANDAATVVGGAAAAVVAARNEIRTGLAGGLGTEFLSNQAAAADRIRANFENIGTAIDTLNQKRLEGINARIGELTGQLDAAREAADLALESVLALITDPLADPFSAAFSDLVLSIPSIAPQLEEALAAAATGEVIPVQQLNQLGQQFLEPFQRAVAAAITANPLITPEQLRAQFADVFAALDQFQLPITGDDGVVTFRPLTDSEKGFFTGQLNSLLENQALAAGLEQVTISSQAVTDLQTELLNLDMELAVQVTFSATQIQEELERMGLSVSLASILSFLDQAEAAAAQNAAQGASSVPGGVLTNDSAQPVVNFNQNITQNISGTTSPQQTADSSAVANRVSAVTAIRNAIGGVFG